MKPRSLCILMLFYLVYLLIGASVFMAMERPQEIRKCKDAKVFKKNLAEEFNTFKDENSFDSEHLDDIIKNISYFEKFGIILSGNVSCPHNWDFQTSLFFSGTIITTIGYGHMSPTLWTSQWFSIAYAIVGIPLFAIMFNEIGKYFSKHFLHLFENCLKDIVTTKTKNIILLTSFGVVGLIFFCMLPAVIFTLVEGWSYSISLYYSVITLTTIGFGDYVAGQNIRKHYIAIYRIMVFFWIIFGLAFMFTFIGILGDMFRKTAKRKKTYEVSTSDDDFLCDSYSQTDTNDCFVTLQTDELGNDQSILPTRGISRR